MISFSRLADGLRRGLDRLVVSRCIACHAVLCGGEYFCPVCAEAYREEKRWECGICGKPLSECTCVNAYMESNALHRLVKLLRYRPDGERAVGNRIIYRMKRHRVLRLHDFMAKDLSEAVRQNIRTDESFLVVPVPRTPKQKRKYGFDHAHLLARALAKEMSLPLALPLLREKSTKVQKTVTGAEGRRQNVKNSFLPKPDISLKGKRILLVDDIVTTGASMVECARVLRKMGAREVVGVAVCISYRHPNIKYEHDANTHEERPWLWKKK